MSVSVIIPIYNVSKHIEKCLISLFSQTLKDIEFIIVDDCSIDNSLEIIHNIINNYPSKRNLVKIIKHPVNLGVSSARNTALLYSSKKYVGFVDADDWLEKDMYTSMYEASVSNDIDFLWTDYYENYKHKQIRKTQLFNDDRILLIEEMLGENMIGAMWNKLIKKDLFISNNVKFSEGNNMCEDLRVCIELLYYSKRRKYLPMSFYHYYKPEYGSLSMNIVRSKHLHQGWVNNILGIQDFLESRSCKFNKRKLNHMKLACKNNLLLSSTSLKDLRNWASIFNEANVDILSSKAPMQSKILAYASYKNISILVSLILILKKVKRKLNS